MPQIPEQSRHRLLRTFAAIGAGALLYRTARFAVAAFGPDIPYALPEGAPAPVDSPQFLDFISGVTGCAPRRSRLKRLRNGSEFYEAQLDAIRRAEHTINLETYEFLRGGVGDAFLVALTERAEAGVAVRVTVDALGSFSVPTSYFKRLTDAGGRMFWYHPFRWNTWQEINNRTHRKLLIVDGRTGFLGGAGIADFWLHATPKQPAWRDTMFLVEGEAVAGLTSTFSENWLECSGEILSGPAQFGFQAIPAGAPGLVVASTPESGTTKARILFQSLMKGAREEIRITTPYFLPDASARNALVEAVRDRGVKVRILTAGPYIDHGYIRTLSRRSSNELLEAGAEIFEYQPSMIHAKLMTIDGQWSLVGSTNFDHRSFALNDEVNLATLDPELAGVIDRDFLDDLKQSRPLTLEILRARMLLGKEPLLDYVLDLES